MYPSGWSNADRHAGPRRTVSLSMPSGLASPALPIGVPTKYEVARHLRYKWGSVAYRPGRIRRQNHRKTKSGLPRHRCVLYCHLLASRHIARDRRRPCLCLIVIDIRPHYTAQFPLQLTHTPMTRLQFAAAVWARSRDHPVREGVNQVMVADEGVRDRSGADRLAGPDVGSAVMTSAQTPREVGGCRNTQSSCGVSVTQSLSLRRCAHGRHAGGFSIGQEELRRGVIAAAA